MTGHALLFLLLAAVLPHPASAAAPDRTAAERPYFNFLGGADPVEGDADKTHQIEWMFSAPLDFEARLTISTSADMSPSATPGEDFVAIPPTVIVVPAGQQSGSFAIVIKGDDLPEESESIEFKVDAITGGGTAIGGGTGPMYDNIYINNDDFPPVPLVANDDFATFVINEGVNVFVGENDVFDEYHQVHDTTTTVLTPPAHGSLVQHDYGSGIDFFGYVPDADYAGRDQFRYRLCKSDGVECIEADVHLQGALREPVETGGMGRAAGLSVDFDALPAMADARFVASSLARASDVAFETGVDATPWNAWDSRDGMAWTTRTLPASPAGTSVRHRLVVNSLADPYDVIDLHVGVDLDGDGAPSAGEQLCAGIATQSVLTACDVPVTVGDEPVTYWIAMHSREEAAKTPGARVFEIAMDAPESDLAVTGPVTFQAGDAVRVRASWNDGTAVGPMVAFVRAFDGSNEVGEFRLNLYGVVDSPQLLPSDGSPFAIDLLPTSQFWGDDLGLFFDVPPGLSALTLSVQGEQGVEFSLMRVVDNRPAESGIDRSFGESISSRVTAPAGQSRTITVDAPLPGRVFVRMKNGADARNRVQVRATLQGTGARLLAGSYFNPSQSGHGLLLYPAADQWAGLWYTYDNLGQPTWYYLQAPKPGVDGVWRAPLFRDAWDGASARHTQVGMMTITPDSDRTFVMSYLVDGSAGSQPMEALGRGCPASEGAPVDISSHYFDPARSGNGYSVQAWPDGYQFIAAFLYDTQGYPLFLAAERPDLGGPVADLALEYLDGTCPVCNYQSPVRMPAGTLRRTLVGGKLEEITLDVDYDQPSPLSGHHAFSVTDRVQLLGGPGTTQGCAP